MRLARSCWFLGLLPPLLIACAVKPAATPSAVFGGKGAEVKETPLPAGSAALDSGPCASAAPESDVALVDDFEDGDAKPFKGYQREGWWFVVGDKSAGSKLSPDIKFEPVHLPAGEANKDNGFAAHLAASGQTEWGVLLGTTLRWTKDGVRCPLNVSAFQGVKFRAKGPGTIRFKVDVPGTTPTDYGGECTKRCYDSPAKLVTLSDRWEDYEVRWDRLQQGGWGTEVRFDPARVLGLGFAVDVKALPADFWLDDISWMPKPSAR